MEGVGKELTEMERKGERKITKDRKGNKGLEKKRTQRKRKKCIDAKLSSYCLQPLLSPSLPPAPNPTHKICRHSNTRTKQQPSTLTYDAPENHIGVA